MTDGTKETASGRVYAALRKKIVGGGIAPGTSLSRSVLAHEHGVSQTPVREALLRLEREGLLDVRAQSKTLVAPIRVVAVHQALFVRQALECEVAERLAADPGKRDLAQADKAVESDDMAFHRALFVALGMGEVFEGIAPLFIPMERVRALAPRDNAQMAKEHCDILDRIFAKDRKGAGRAMSAHLLGEIEALGALQSEKPDYFQGD